MMEFIRKNKTMLAINGALITIIGASTIIANSFERTISKPISETLKEEAEVIDLEFVPRKRQSAIGMGLNGKLGIVQVNSRDNYIITLRSDNHGKFTYSQEEENGRKIWETLQVGDKVEVTYRSDYRCNYHIKPWQFHKEFIGKEKEERYEVLDIKKK